MMATIGSQIGQFIERKSADDALRRLAAIVESSDDAIIGMRLDGTVVSWNAGATRMFGYTAKEMIGESVRRLFPDELKSPKGAGEGSDESVLISRLVRGERVEPYETTRIRKDGERIDVSVSISPILDSSGAIVGAAKIARDITATKGERESLRSVHERIALRAAELERQIEQSASMAQELRESNEQLNKALAAARRAQQDAEAANRELKQQTTQTAGAVDAAKPGAGERH
jgi:PAS domain S-box-containing protein